MLLFYLNARLAQAIGQPVLINFFQMAMLQVAMQGERGFPNLVTELEYFFLSFHNFAPFVPFCGNVFCFYCLIHSTISFAMSSGDLSFTILVSRSCFGSATLAKFKPSPASFTGLAFCNAGITVRMLTMPTCGLFLGSGKLPVAQPSNAGAPAHFDT